MIRWIRVTRQSSTEGKETGRETRFGSSYHISVSHSLPPGTKHILKELISILVGFWDHHDIKLKTVFTLFGKDKDIRGTESTRYASSNTLK